MYDAIVIGSRCAGAPTAMLLARRGRRVLLVDRATFPSDVISGHAIQPAGVARLARWGLLDRVRATGTPFTSRVRFDFGPVVLDGTPDPVEGQDATVCIRRTILDALLTDAAAEAGAEVRLGVTVKDLLWEDGRVVGVRGRDAAGAPVEERAAIVVGADGHHSGVARAVGAGAYAQHAAATVNAYSYWRGLDLDAVELYSRPDRFLIALPTNDGLSMVVAIGPVAEAPRWRADVAGTFAEALGRVPQLGERVAAAERAERFRLTSDSAAFLREPHGPGWALVGDAAHHLDAITAQGMLNAFRDADELSAAVDDGLAAGDLDGALAVRRERRDAAVLPVHEFTAGLAHVELPPPPVLPALVAAAAADPALTSRFLGIIAGSTRVEELLAPASLERILGTAAAAA